MANDAQTLALAQTFYETARFSPADRKSQAVSKIQVALNELLDAPKAPVHLEKVARALCIADGEDPDAPGVIGQPRLLRNGRGYQVFADAIHPLWTQYHRQAVAVAEALGVTLAKLDMPGVIGGEIVEDGSVIKYDLVSVTQEELRNRATVA